MVRHAGGRTAKFFDAEMGEPCQMLVLYPSTGVEQPEPIGPYGLDVAMNGPVAPGTFPLVIVSHGTGGSHLTHRLLGAYLARRGFVVVLLEHARNNRNRDDLANTFENLVNRPRHVRLAIDWAYSDAMLGAHLLPNTVAVIGHSLGGYTALAVAGGHPMAVDPTDGHAHAVPVTPDARVRALVLLAPATPWYQNPGTLGGVRVPILMLTGERDPHTSAWHGEVVLRGLPSDTPVTHHVVPNAGHFSFLSPFPEAMARPGFAPAQDPPGFDRARFHDEMYPAIEAFLRRSLGSVHAEVAPGHDVAGEAGSHLA